MQHTRVHAVPEPVAVTSAVQLVTIADSECCADS